MAPIEAIKEERHHHHHHHDDTISLRRERRRIWKMKVIFGVFSAALLLSLVLSWILSH
jgi:hypothetical protein